MEKLIEDDVLCAVNATILQRVVAISSATQAHQFEDAQSGQNQLTTIISELSGAPVVCNINSLQGHIKACLFKYVNIVRNETEFAFLEEFRRLEAAEKNRE